MWGFHCKQYFIFTRYSQWVFELFTFGVFHRQGYCMSILAGMSWRTYTKVSEEYITRSRTAGSNGGHLFRFNVYCQLVAQSEARCALPTVRRGAPPAPCLGLSQFLVFSSLVGMKYFLSMITNVVAHLFVFTATYV